MKATKKNMQDQILTSDSKILYCPGCGVEYSGNAGDYFMLPDDYVFHCENCDVEMELVNKVVTTTYC